MSEEKRISREEFDEAVKTVTDDFLKDKDHDGMAKMMVLLTGMMFAGKVKEILFGDSKGEK